ncbi:MAG: NAD-glutamate dehydrogenase domain-containing protein, partial [Actinomycetota bacterium]
MFEVDLWGAVNDPVIEHALEQLENTTAAADPLALDIARVLLRRPPEHLRSYGPKIIAERIAGIVERLRHGEPEPPCIRTFSDDPSPAPTATLEIICPDRPFLLSTVRAELEGRGLPVTGMFHPILGVERADDGELVAVQPARHAKQRESILQLEVDAPVDRLDDELITAVEARLTSVRRVTDDHQAMRARIAALADQLEAASTADAEVVALLHWILDDNLVLLGVGRASAPDEPATVTADDGHGLLAPDAPERIRVPLVESDRTLLVTRTRELSPVQRHVPMEVFAVRAPDGAADTGRELIVGLLTRKGTDEPTHGTPVLRQRLLEVFELEDVVDGSHEAITLTTIFQALPKDELFRSDVAGLHDLLTTLLDAEERRVVRVVVRDHRPSGTTSVVVAVPHDRWTAHLRDAIRSDLLGLLEADTIEADVAVGERRMALARFSVAGAVSEPDPQRLERRIAELARSWPARVRQHLIADQGSVAPELDRLLSRLPPSYRETMSPSTAVDDLKLLASLDGGDTPSLHLELRRGEDDHLRLVAAKRGVPLELSSFLPIIESLGLTVVDEVPHRLVSDADSTLTLHDFGLRAPDVDVERHGERITESIRAAWRGHLEVDALNRCVITAGIDWRDVGILRTFRRYRRQLGTAYTTAYMDEIMVANPSAVRALVDHLHARLDPEWGGPDAEHTKTAMRQALEALTRLDQDRVLRGLLRLIDATVRTNAFRSDARADDTGEPYVALKIDPSRLRGMPLPVPYREVFVRSPRVEGVHLRAGPVARGGLRWSDRKDDVRSEVLDLLKAQIHKNAVIVPTGAKGAFVLTHEPNDPDELREEVARQYRVFVRGLLDVTDDLEGDEIDPPPQVIRHDGDDPYLVVAADRGTATFSDDANRLARHYGFWLDDAFASGGSNGYDHKQLGVTARGAWVAVSRHARELGLDLQSDPATVAGVGDMSGDVFGNALLQSRAIRLVAAFDHRHVFLDPDPDPQASFAERARLAALPRSSWDDYDRRVLFNGGLIVSRDARSVVLTPQVREVLRVQDEELSPPELIRAILRAPVDLLFAGGIGTYIKASTERHGQLGDRANDELRVDANQVRARIVGEGANLFLTQRARIELARRGARINQDAIDNAAGVITSDSEVNLKILLRLAEERGELRRDERDRLLAELSDEVVAMVMATIDRQTAGLSREAHRSPRMIGAYTQLMRRLETESDLDRAGEVLPDDAQLVERRDAGAGLTRPELATLLAWAKRDLKEALLDSTVPDGDDAGALAAMAFPPSVRERYPELIAQHRLRRELVATVLANDLVDRMGVTFVSQLAEETDRTQAEIVATFQWVRHIIDADRWWAALDQLDATQEAERVRELELPLEELLAILTRTLASDPTAPTSPRGIEAQRRVAHALIDNLGDVGTSDQRRARLAHMNWLVDDLVEPDLARLLAAARDLSL